MSEFDPIDFLETAVELDTTDEVDSIREIVVEVLEERGISATVDGVGNLLASRGSGRPHLVFNSHFDTVSPHLSARREDGVLYGRGACDAAGPLAAMLAAFLDADVSDGDGQLTLALVPDEETDSRGAAALVGRGALEPGPDAVVVGEPTGLDVCTAARGRFQATVTVHGEAAHAADPDAGHNAALAAVPVLSALETFDDRPDAPPAHPELGSPTLTPTVVEAGDATNQVPATFSVVVDRRSVPPETQGEFVERLRAHLESAVEPPATVEVAFADRETPFLGPWETDAEEPVVGALVDASGGTVRSFGAATEASYFAGLAPTVVFGPGDLFDDEGPVAHAEREYVRLAEVEAASEALTEAVERLLDQV